jgi:hypothetical protein
VAGENPMSYSELCKSLGIDREAITKALDVPTSTSVGREKEYFRDNIGPRVKPPMEDVSHLIDPYGQTISKRLKKK